MKQETRVLRVPLLLSSNSPVYMRNKNKSLSFSSCFFFQEHKNTGHQNHPNTTTRETKSISTTTLRSKRRAPGPLDERARYASTNDCARKVSPLSDPSRAKRKRDKERNLLYRSTRATKRPSCAWTKLRPNGGFRTAFEAELGRYHGGRYSKAREGLYYTLRGAPGHAQGRVLRHRLYLIYL